MARLVLLNGPPGIGKSVLAERYVADQPFALNLDLDSIRRLIGGWREQPLQTGLLARALSLEMARVHLAAGHDVVIPQYLGRPQFLDEAESVARAAGVPFAEFVLTDSREDALRRFEQRTAAAETVAHAEAGERMELLGGRAALEAMYDRLLLVLSHRPNAQVIHSIEGDIDATYAELRKRLDANQASF